MTNAVLWMEYARTCKASLDTLTYQNGLLKKKINNLDFSLKYCNGQNEYLRQIINKDDSIIRHRDVEVLGLKKSNENKSKAMKIIFPILGGIAVAAVTYTVLQ